MQKDLVKTIHGVCIEKKKYFHVFLSSQFTERQEIKKVIGKYLLEFTMLLGILEYYLEEMLDMNGIRYNFCCQIFIRRLFLTFFPIPTPFHRRIRAFYHQKILEFGSNFLFHKGKLGYSTMFKNFQFICVQIHYFFMAFWAA